LAQSWVEVVSVILAAAVGGIATYVASYCLERQKWSHKATLDRKEGIYAPIFDELSWRIRLPSTLEGWRRGTMQLFRIGEWQKVRGTSLAFTVPSELRKKLDKLCNAADVYNSTRGSFWNELSGAFKKDHAGVPDRDIAFALADKMIAMPSEQDGVVIEYVESQNPNVSPENKAALRRHWSDKRLARATTTISRLPSWTSVQQAHADYMRLMQEAFDDLGRRIQSVVKKLEPPAQGL